MDNPPESDILNPQLSSFPTTTVTGQQDTSSSSELLKGVDDKKRIAQLGLSRHTIKKIKYPIIKNMRFLRFASSLMSDVKN
jgi:hypothetical protein